MAKAKKISKEELESVRLTVTNFNRLKASLGELEFEKSKVLAQVSELETALKGEQKSLEDKYGQVTINLDTGEYEEVVQEAEEVK